MKINIDLPGVVRVVDMTTYKGHEVKVAYIFDQPAMYFIGDPYFTMDNEDWENRICKEMAEFFGKMLCIKYSPEWSIENPTGQGLYELHPVDYIQER